MTSVVEALSHKYKLKLNEEIYAIYIHIMLSLIDNIKDFADLEIIRDKILPLSKVIDNVNIVNAHCIHTNINMIRKNAK